MKVIQYAFIGPLSVPGPILGSEQNRGQNWPKFLPSGSLCSHKCVFHNATMHTELKFIVGVLVFSSFLFAFMDIFFQKMGVVTYFIFNVASLPPY